MISRALAQGLKPEMPLSEAKAVIQAGALSAEERAAIRARHPGVSDEAMEEMARAFGF